MKILNHIFFASYVLVFKLARGLWSYQNSKKDLLCGSPCKNAAAEVYDLEVYLEVYNQ